MATANQFVSLPVEIFSNIVEYLDWGDVGRLDTAFLNRKTRNGYLFALQLRTVKVERNIIRPRREKLSNSPEIPWNHGILEFGKSS